MIRLKAPQRWQVLCAFVSILWAIGAWIDEHGSGVAAANSLGALTYKTCTNEKLLAQDTDLTTCEARRVESINKWRRDGNSAFNEIVYALAPIPFVWLAGFILIYTVQAQIAGFRAVIPWKILSPIKKAFVAICAFLGFAALAAGALATMNLYVDQKVPVSPFPFLDILRTGPEFVTVNGTWVRTDLTDDTIANPLQTSRIECRKAEGRCVSATAYVVGSVLGTELNRFEIKSWTQDAVVFESVEACATEIYTIDFNTRIVNGAGHLTNQEVIDCQMNLTAGKGSWTYRLSSGLNVYWDLRKKARPVILRIVQAAFGN